MMTKLLRFFQIVLFFSVLLVFYTGCIEEPTMKSFDGVSVQRFDKEGIVFNSRLTIENPNKLSFKVSNIDLNVKLNGIDVGKAKLLEPVKIEKNCSKSYSFLLQSSFKNLSFASLPSIIAAIATGKTNLELEGKIAAKKFMIKKRVPIEYDKKISF